MVISIQNPYDGQKPEDVARKFIDQRVFIGWPFLHEGKVVAVSDSMFKYEKMSVVPGQEGKVVSTPHAFQALHHWKSKAERIESVYSKRCGVLTGEVEVMLHVRPLKGLKREEDGAFVKDYEGLEKEVESAVQMSVVEVSSEDPRYVERAPPPIKEEFPEGSKVFFLGEHGYGVAAQVSATDEEKDTLSVILAFFPAERLESDRFKEIVNARKASRYFLSYRATDMVGISGRALGKITSSFMVLTSDEQKNNLGLSIKFEAKALKVIDYSRKEGRTWEYSEKAIQLIREYKAAFPEVFASLDGNGDAMARATDIFGRYDDPDAKVREVKAFLKSKGVRDLEPVSLFCDHLSKETVVEIEKVEDELTQGKSGGIRKAIVKGIPRRAVLKPTHAAYRLQNQHFALGDRVTMVKDSGGVPLSVKGVVIGLNAKSMDVIWDVPFISGVTLGDRCSQYRGSTVEFSSCLNLSNPQFVTSTNPKAPAPVRNNAPFNPKFGPHPIVQPAPGQQAASGFRPRPQSNGQPMKIMLNPNRGGRGGGAGWANGHSGRGGPAPQPSTSPIQPQNTQQPANVPAAGAPRGGPRGRGGPPFRGGRGFDRGRGAPRGDFRRGRGRGGFAPAQSS
ncbi:hypothetical protein FA13DRAFT_1627125 [Coprinellus micaceus]|uniref:Uncharacterized protein n=1 Tax=Coprinellus micaceus TaxID=71717 RepID=A0A4Y7TH63_COPMI|nr:hypothetical protein FA13DRAFT_1627125 [Coprinellus micaceus]